jgi:hypothetical protein
MCPLTANEHLLLENTFPRRYPINPTKIIIRHLSLGGGTSYAYIDERGIRIAQIPNITVIGFMRNLSLR